MDALILTEASGTTRGDHLDALEHYRGNFLPVKTLTERLSQFADTDTYIITDNYGLLHATDTIENASIQDRNQALTDARQTLQNQIPDTDIVVILTTSDTFRTLIADNWNSMIDAANSDSVWCLSSGRAALSECNLEDLRERVHTLHIYERVGVAPIDNDTQDALVNTIETISRESL